MRMTHRLMNSRRPVTRSRTGFTMAETLVVLVLLAIVGGSLMNVLTKQQQFYNGTGELIVLRTQLRQAEAILGGDLRGISSSGGDITTMTDSSIEFNYTIGTSVVCKAPSGSAVVIPPTGALTNGNTLTSWISKPTFGDQAYIFDEGAYYDRRDRRHVEAVQRDVAAHRFGQLRRGVQRAERQHAQP